MIDKQLLQSKIGERVRELREAKEISQVLLAEKTSMEKSNLARLESGRTNPTILTLMKIAHSLDVPITELVNIDL